MYKRVKGRQNACRRSRLEKQEVMYIRSWWKTSFLFSMYFSPCLCHFVSISVIHKVSLVLRIINYMLSPLVVSIPVMLLLLSKTPLFSSLISHFSSPFVFVYCSYVLFPILAFFCFLICFISWPSTLIWQQSFYKNIYYFSS